MLEDERVPGDIEVEMLDEEEAVLPRAVDDKELAELSCWYMFNLFEPPQYSPVLFLQIILQPLTLGTELV